MSITAGSVIGGVVMGWKVSIRINAWWQKRKERKKLEAVRGE